MSLWVDDAGAKCLRTAGQWIAHDTKASSFNKFFDLFAVQWILICIFATDNKGETNKKSAMSQNNIDFVTYCIGNLARRLGISAGEVYRKLKDSGILTEYIVPSYDVLHTFSKEYLMEDLTEYMKEKGVLA